MFYIMWFCSKYAEAYLHREKREQRGIDREK